MPEKRVILLSVAPETLEDLWVVQKFYEADVGDVVAMLAKDRRAVIKATRGKDPGKVMTLRQVEALHITHTLEACSGDFKKAAALLGIGLSTLRVRCAALGLRLGGGR